MIGVYFLIDKGTGITGTGKTYQRGLWNLQEGESVVNLLSVEQPLCVCVCVCVEGQRAKRSKEQVFK